MPRAHSLHAALLAVTFTLAGLGCSAQDEHDHDHDHNHVYCYLANCEGMELASGCTPWDAWAPDGGRPRGVPDGGAPDAGVVDAGTQDAGAQDAGLDATTEADNGPQDAGVQDADLEDLGAVDVGWDDTTPQDGAAQDVALQDVALEDVAQQDAGLEDAGLEDAGLQDAGLEDAGLEDAGLQDAGLEDAGLQDAGLQDAGPPGTEDGGAQGDGADDSAWAPEVTPDIGSQDAGQIDPGAADAQGDAEDGGTSAVPVGDLKPDVPLKKLFRQGDSGYDGTRDLHLSVPAGFFHKGQWPSNFPSDGEHPFFAWDLEDTWGVGPFVDTSHASKYGVGDDVGLIQFADLFGAEDGQIPRHAKIVKAVLTMHARVPGDRASLHRVLIPWDEGTRWNTFGAAPGPQYVSDLHPAVEHTLPSGAALHEVDVTNHVQAWAQAPETNHGWAMMPGGTQSVIKITGSKLFDLTSVRVKLKIKAARRGEVVVTLRHGSYTALLVNRPGRMPCNANIGHTQPDFDVTIDPGAYIDIHQSSFAATPLTGTFAPDHYCFDGAPICTPNGGGLCGQYPDGDWVLTVMDEWVAQPDSVNLVEWSIILADGIHPNETYVQNQTAAVPNRSLGDSYQTQIWSSEAPKSQNRPSLLVEYLPTLSFASPSLRLWPDGGTVPVTVVPPKGATIGAPMKVTAISSDPSVVAVSGTPAYFPQNSKQNETLELMPGKPGKATVWTLNDRGFGESSMEVVVAKSGLSGQPASLFTHAGAKGHKLTVQIPAGYTQDAYVIVKTDKPDIVKVNGKSEIKLVFPVFGATTKQVDLTLGNASGAANIFLIDEDGLLKSTLVPVQVSAKPAEEYEVVVKPYLQLAAGSDGVTGKTRRLVWQTTTLRTGGMVAETFKVELRKAGTTTWSEMSEALPGATLSDSWKVRSANLTGLEPDTTYEYRLTQLRNGEPIPGAVWQDSFASPLKGDLRFTASGNTGTGDPAQYASANVIAALDPDVHMVLGDMVYDSGDFNQFTSRLFAPYATLMGQRLFAYTEGNHDQKNQGNVQIHLASTETGPDGVAAGRHFYFDIGDVRFFSVSSVEPSMAKASDWLKAGILNSPRTWNVVMTHELPVSRDPFGIDRKATPEVRQQLLKPAVEAGADLFLGGAAHSYQRYLPVTKVVDTAQEIVTASCPGGDGTTVIYAGTATWARVPGKPVPDTQKPPLVKYMPEVGMVVFDVSGESMTVRFINAAGTERDKIVLKKCTSAAACPCP